MVLAHHDLIGSAQVTGYPGTEGKLPASGYRNESVVVDEAQRLITSQGPGTAVAFALAAVRMLEGKTIADKVAVGMVLQ